MKTCEVVSKVPPTHMEKVGPIFLVTMPQKKLNTPNAYGMVLMFISCCCESAKCFLRAGE